MKKLKRILLAVRKNNGVINEQGYDGFSCQIPRMAKDYSYSLCIIASWGEGWEHVSIHARKEDAQFTPFWEDMCYVKNLFFKPSETVVQFHPPLKDYVNIHQHVLHLWRPINEEIKLPPKWMV